MGIILIVALIVAGISLYDYFSSRRWLQVTSSDRNEIVFAQRNKEYGAYVLRRDYDKRMVIILISVFASMGLAFGIFKFIKNLPEEKDNKPKVDLKQLTLTPAKPENEKLPPPPPEPPTPPQQRVVANPPPVVVDIDVDTEVPTQNSMDNVKTGAKDQEGKDDGFDFVSGPTGPVNVEVKKVEKIEDFVEEDPEFPGGMDAFYQWVVKKMVFPEDSEGGDLFVKIVISKDGHLSNVMFLKRSSPELEREVQRVLLQSPKWKAGKIDGKSVTCYYEFPISFQR
jgi:protein TonB